MWAAPKQFGRETNSPEIPAVHIPIDKLVLILIDDQLAAFEIEPLRQTYKERVSEGPMTLIFVMGT